MLTASLSSSGRISLPAKVRMTLGLKAGDRVGFVELEKGTFFLVAMNVPLRQLRGRLMGKRRVSIDEMNPAKFARNYFPRLAPDLLRPRVPDRRRVFEIRIVCQVAAQRGIVAKLFVLHHLLARADRIEEVDLMINYIAIAFGGSEDLGAFLDLDLV